MLSDARLWGALTSYNKKDAVHDNVLKIQNDPIRLVDQCLSPNSQCLTVMLTNKQLSIMSFRICNANKRIILMYLWRPIITVQKTYMPH